MDFFIKLFDTINPYSTTVCGRAVIPEYELNMYREVFSAIFTVDGGWDYFRTRDTSKPFSLNVDPIYINITNEYSKYPSSGNHSGASFACMMRQVEFIILNGFNIWVDGLISNVKEKSKTY
jgi:hypothetical protein